mgnify:CR=1 FL=1|tara:strand:+ start:40 stop:678 length:639 start_codon:yes stop_codon:yes gene_type:complete
MTANLVIVEKLGSLKEVIMKELDVKNLYKKCNFRKSEGFEKRHTFKNIKLGGIKYNVSVYARDDGKANFENKYDLPPPLDNSLFYGNLALVREDDDGSLLDLSLKEWEKIYEKLFGGFEDLSSTAQEDEEEEDELKNLSPSKLTKQGYLKDGFVVDTNSDNEAVSEEEDADLKTMSENETSSQEEDNISDLCESDNEGSELEEEEFIFSDED